MTDMWHLVIIYVTVVIVMCDVILNSNIRSQNKIKWKIRKKNKQSLLSLILITVLVT